jgi:hypothetical protein
MSACHVSTKQPQWVLQVTHSGLGMVQLDASSKATLCKQAKLRDDELVELGARLASSSREGATITLASLGHNCIVSMSTNSQETKRPFDH